MKKILYILAFAITTSVIISSCTEEDVKPTDPSCTIIGGGSTDPF